MTAKKTSTARKKAKAKATSVKEEQKALKKFSRGKKKVAKK